MKTKRTQIWSIPALAFLLVLILTGSCKKDDYVEIVGVCPVVESTNPANTATGVALNQAVTATFNEEMNPSTITPASFILTGGLSSGDPIAGTLTYDNTNATLSFVPTLPLAQNTTYTGTVKSTIKDLQGNALQTNYAWTFTTGTLLAPTVISTDPANSATGVFINKVVTATFSVAMDPLTITAVTFTPMQGTNSVAGTVSYSGITATFVPLSDLTPNTVYTISVTIGAKNTVGTAMENNYVWNFTTGSITGPTVISTDPTNNATGVPVNKTVSATFSMVMDPLTLSVTTFTVKQGLTVVAGTVSYNGTTASFVPSLPLTANALYVCTITTGAKSATGIALAANYVWSFTTLSPTAPMVILTDPLNNATDVVLGKMVTATFNTPMDPLTLNATTFTLKQGTTPVVGIISYFGSTVSFSHTTAFLPNTVYTATITSGAKNLAGTPMAADYIWTFTTAAAAAGPTVIMTDPANLATGVVLTKMVTATFSETMDPLTLTAATFTLKQGTTPVVGIISYFGSTVSFSHSIAFLPNTVYTATITNGAKNVAGTAMAADYVWTFTTAAAAAAPTVILTDPLNLATGVILTKMVIATFSEPMDPLTLTAATFTLKQGTTPVAGLISYFGSTVSFSHTIAFLPNTVYTATITTGAKNVGGIAMATDYVWTFTTAAPAAAPTVILTDPLNLATGVILTKMVTATFNEPMDPLTLTAATFTIKQGTTPVSGIIAYFGSTVSFSHTTPFLPNTVYTATITTGAKNVAGIPLAADYVWAFTTAAAAVAPVVLSTDPLNNAINVALNKTVTATFDMPMDPLTITGTTFTLKLGSTAVAGAVTYSGTTASFNPTSDLVSNTLYTATITTGAKSLAGIALVIDYAWSFTTVTGTVPPNIDLGSAAIFGAFGGNAGVTNQGIFTVVNGAIATTAASSLITGFHDGLTADVYTETPLNVGLVTNGIFTAPPFPGTATSFAIATQGLLDAQTAYNFTSAASMPGGMDPGAGELGGLTLAPGIYKSASGTFNISNGPLTLDAQGDPNATWVFQTAAGLTVGIAGPTGARSIILINGALPKNVFWHIGTAATINGAGGGIMVGTIIAYSGVTFSTAGNVALTLLNGRALSLVASVTMVNTIVNVPLP